MKRARVASFASAISMVTIACGSAIGCGAAPRPATSPAGAPPVETPAEVHEEATTPTASTPSVEVGADAERDAPAAAKTAPIAADRPPPATKPATSPPPPPMPPPISPPAPASRAGASSHDGDDRSGRVIRAQNEFDLARKIFAEAGSDCATLCKALASMSRATTHLCDLTRDGADAEQHRCVDAKRKLAAADAKVKGTCGGCGDP